MRLLPTSPYSADGTLHMFWHMDGSNPIQYLRSTDGGASFEPLKEIVTGVHSLRGNLPLVGGFPHFDGGKFRVVTIVTSCAAPGGRVIVVWADMREGRSRIYFRRSDDNGITWKGPANGQPFLPNVSYGDRECFHPQVACTTATGVVGCSFYVFGRWRGIPPARLELRRRPAAELGGAEVLDPTYRIHVQFAGSWDLGKTFPRLTTVTDMPWDPLVKPPFSHGDSHVHFIGDYFGLDAGDENFAILWTDAPTGMQELFFDLVGRSDRAAGHPLESSPTSSSALPRTVAAWSSSAKALQGATPRAASNCSKHCRGRRPRDRRPQGNPEGSEEDRRLTRIRHPARTPQMTAATPIAADWGVRSARVMMESRFDRPVTFRTCTCCLLRLGSGIRRRQQ